MKSKNIFIILFSIFVYACLPNTVNAQKTILWEVSHSEKEKKSYLLGTYHQVGNSFVDSMPIIKELLLSSEVAFFESVDPVDSLIATMNRRTEQFEYKKILRNSEIEFLESHTKKWTVPVSKLTPIELIIKLRQDYILYTCGTAQPADKWDHFDNYLIHLAQTNGIPIKGFETDEIQSRYINAASKDYTWNKAKPDIKRFIKRIQKSQIEPEICGFAQSYMSFELDDYRFEEELSDSSITSRNNLWMPILLAHLEDKKVFTATGLLHLFGKSGIIQQLRREGFEVNPIKIKKKPSP